MIHGAPFLCIKVARIGKSITIPLVKINCFVWLSCPIWMALFLFFSIFRHGLSVFVERFLKE